jgi:hypothetical protein
MADDQNQAPIVPPPAEVTPAVIAPPAAPTSVGMANNSGQGPGTPVPAELQGWCWAGFLMSWIWAIPHKAWLAFGIGIAPLVIGFAFRPLRYLGIVAAIFCGIKGNEWAWQNRQWVSIQEFKDTQRVWVIWGLALLALGIVGAIISVVAAATLLGAAAVGAAHGMH